MSRWVWGYCYWGVGWLLLGFLTAELAGFFGVAPWPTFSETVWHAIRYPGVGPAVFATLVFLGVHFLYHRPVWHSVLFGLVVAGVAHWLDKRLQVEHIEADLAADMAALLLAEIEDYLRLVAEFQQLYPEG